MPADGRLHEVVLDGVAGARHLGLLQAVDGAHDLELHLGRQAGGNAVQVDPRMIAPLRLDEDLVPVAVGEAHDLVLDRRAVARTGRGDPPGVQGGAVETPSDEGMRSRVREGDVTIDLGRCDRIGLEGERYRLRIARLPIEDVEIDRAPQDSRRRAGLQPSHRETQSGQGFRQADPNPDERGRAVPGGDHLDGDLGAANLRLDCPGIS